MTTSDAYEINVSSPFLVVPVTFFIYFLCVLSLKLPTTYIINQCSPKFKETRPRPGTIV